MSMTWLQGCAVALRGRCARLFLTIGCMLLPLCAQAQELNATVTVNTQQIEASYQSRFETLRQSLEEFINGQTWSAAQFATNERITCTFALTINEIASADLYNASLTVQARRPVYNSSYQTVILNWRDDNFTLPYQEGQNMQYNEYNVGDDELIATVAFYCYLVLGLDFDSFSPLGGEPYFRKCESIVSQMQSSENKGWKAFDSHTNRHALATALLEEKQQPFRKSWYTYHRAGLDAMAQGMDKGRAQITSALTGLEETRAAETQTPLLSLFINAKLDELCNVYSEAPKAEKKTIYERLTALYPTYSSQLNVIKEEHKD